MRICFLAPANSLHMVKWCNYFTAKGHEVHIVTLHEGRIDGVSTHQLITNAKAASSDFAKLAYLTCAREARRVLNEVQPDIVNAHYASSYGALAALACERPYILSVWGSDIYDFPNKSPLHRALLKFSLGRATTLFSTSRAMAEEAAKYTDKAFQITPFGVDTTLFHPRPRDHGDAFVVSIVKTLSPKYGIDVLIEAAAEVVARRPDIPLKLRIAGTGPDEAMLKAFACGLGLQDKVEWLGFISQEEAAKVWADADVAVVSSSSSSESFGVAAVEAQACGTPVIVADTPGLLEATAPGRSSLVFPRGNAHMLSNQLIKLFEDTVLRQQLGRFGRQFVLEEYSYSKCFGEIESLFVDFAGKCGGAYA